MTHNPETVERPPKYKEPIEIMAADICDAWKEDADYEGTIDPLSRTFILGQGDYPTGYQIIQSAADEIRALRAALSKETAALVEAKAAVLKERERCAKIAREWNNSATAGHAKRGIAAAIRETPND